jgi:hypothetical protein
MDAECRLVSRYIIETGPIVPRLAHRRRADRGRKPSDALNARRPQRLRRALRVAGLRARIRAQVARVLRDLGDPEPPLDLDASSGN